MSELLYYALMLLVTIGIALIIAVYYQRQVRRHLDRPPDLLDESGTPLTYKARFSYLVASVIIMFIFPGNLYLWARMRQHARPMKLSGLRKTKTGFFIINLLTASLVGWSLYVLHTSSILDRNMEALDRDGFYLSDLDGARATYIKSFLDRARPLGLSEAKRSELLAAVKMFEQYVFTYRVPTAYSAQPYRSRYKVPLGELIHEYSRSSARLGDSEILANRYDIAKHDVDEILRLIQYAPKEVLDIKAGIEALDVSQIHRWSDAMIASILGEETHIIARQQSLRENFFLVFRYDPAAYLRYILPWIVVTLLLNVFLDRAYFRIYETHPDACSQSAYDAKSCPGRVIAPMIAVVLLWSGIHVALDMGSFLDVTQKAEKADLIVALGGGGKERLLKALELYERGYSEQGTIAVTGSSTFVDDIAVPRRYDKVEYLVEHGVSEHDVIYVEQTHNTMSELLAIKTLMVEKGYRRVLIVTDPPHSRRIKVMARSLAGFDEAGLSCTVVSSGVPWWDREHYYEDMRALRFVVFESLKLPYNLIRYSLIGHIGADPDGV